MKQKLIGLSQRYVAALRKYLKLGSCAIPPCGTALGLGREAVALGLETLELARIHERALATLELSNNKNGLMKRAKIFFTEAITPIEKSHRAALKTNARLSQLNKTLGRRTVELEASSRSLKQGIARRNTAEEELRKGGKHYATLLRESHHLQKHLRHLTHQILSAQEAERKKISCELHDEVAQTLLGINVRLLTLKKAAKGNTANLTKEIASTQRLVVESVQSINRFARELDTHQQA
jgi:signal transduction histidine kinase